MIAKINGIKSNARKSLNKCNDIINEEHAGFAVTLEVLATLSMLVAFLNATLYILRVMDVQRYMNTVLTSTAAQAARWGGTDSKAYKDNVSETSLLDNARQQLKHVVSDFGPFIDGNPPKITYNGQPITITIEYNLPSVFSTMSKVNGIDGNSYDMYEKTKKMKMQVTVNSVMEAGKLL